MISVGRGAYLRSDASPADKEGEKVNSTKLRTANRIDKFMTHLPFKHQSAFLYSVATLSKYFL